MKIKKMLLATTLSVGLFSATSAHAVLTLSVDGNTVYDSDLNITWLQNANLAATNTFGVSGIGSGGRMTWNTAQNWIAGMNAANYLGYNDWRLPTTIDTGTPGCDYLAKSGTDCGWNVDTATGEMAHLWYDELGNKSYYDASGNYQPGWGLTNTGPFSNVQSDYYWSGAEYAPNTDEVAWSFDTGYGGQYGAYKNYNFMYAWAVRPGQVAAVPEPETYAMLLAGLGLLGFTARRRKQSA